MPRYLFVLFLSLLPVFSVQAQKTIHEGDLYLNEGETLNLAGDTLIITGNFYQEGGTVNINGGSLVVEGNYIIQNVTTDCGDDLVCKSSDSYLIMVNASDRVSVGGDFVMHSQNMHVEKMTDGVLTLHGDFTAYNEGAYGFDSQENHKLVFAGPASKKVHFTDPAGGMFNIIEFEEGSSGNIEFDSRLDIEGLKSNNVELAALSFEYTRITLLDDLTISGDLVLEDGQILTEGHTLHVKGSVLHSGGVIGTSHDHYNFYFDVDGDYRLQTFIQDHGTHVDYRESEGYLSFGDFDSVMRVGGDFVTDSVVDHTDLLQKGTLYVSGDFSQLFSSTADDSGENFNAGEYFTVVLNGTGPQNVYMERYRSSEFGTLKLENIHQEGVVFNSNISVNVLFDHQRIPFSFDLSVPDQGNYFNDYDNDGLLDPDDRYPTIHNELDTDEDGLTDIVELDIGSDENNPDSDEDGQMDGYDSEPLDDRYIGTSFTATNVTGEFSTVYLPGYFEKPVVIAGVPSFNDPDPGVVQIMDIFEGVGETGVTLRFKEWNYLSDAGDYEHGEETIPLMILESGRMKMADGSIWEAGTFEIDGTGKFKNVKFSSPFEGRPLLLLTVQSSDTQYVVVTPRVRHLTEEGFRAAIFEEELAGKGYESAVVGYLAGYNVSDNAEVNFGGEMIIYETEIQQLNERWQDSHIYQIKLEEEQSKDDEVMHVPEEVNVLLVDNNIFAQDVTSNGNDTAAIRHRRAP